MPFDPLVIDTENREDPKALQVKVLYAGDEWDGQPYVAVAEDGINLVGDKTHGIVCDNKFGTTIGGNLSLSMMPDQISIGGGYFRLNPLLLSCIPSTTPTPIPTLIKDTPNLLKAKGDVQSARDLLISNSDAAQHG